jgi:hypothetical protein
MNDLVELRAEMRRLTDRNEIIAVFDRFGAAADMRDWDLMRDVFTPDAVLDHTAAHEADAAYDSVWDGFDMLLDKVRTGSERHAVTHHVITNHNIKLDDDRASVVANMLQVHADVQPDGTQSAQIQQGWYLTELVRTKDGWRIRRLKPSLWKAVVVPIAEPLEERALDARRREGRAALDAQLLSRSV